MSDCGHAEMGTLCTKCGKVIVPLYRADSEVIDDMLQLLALIEQYRFEDGYHMQARKPTASVVG